VLFEYQRLALLYDLLSLGGPTTYLPSVMCLMPSASPGQVPVVRPHRASKNQGGPISEYIGNVHVDYSLKTNVKSHQSAVYVL
jgi:hypothetical protein